MIFSCDEEVTMSLSLSVTDDVIDILGEVNDDGDGIFEKVLIAKPNPDNPLMPEIAMSLGATKKGT